VDDNFVWFEKVHTVKIYEAKDMKNSDALALFLTRFRNLRILKGIT